MIDLKVLKENPELAKNLRLEITGADLLEYSDHIATKLADAKIKEQQGPSEEYLTPQQFADALQVSLVTLWSWDHKGLTRPLRIGNKKRYRRSDLEKILQQE